MVSNALMLLNRPQRPEPLSRELAELSAQSPPGGNAEGQVSRDSQPKPQAHIKLPAWTGSGQSDVRDEHHDPNGQNSQRGQDQDAEDRADAGAVRAPSRQGH